MCMGMGWSEGDGGGLAGRYPGRPGPSQVSVDQGGWL